MLVYVINQHGKPLMPCKPRQARKLLSSGSAKVVKREPFTIQLLYGSSGYTQSITLGIDAGYSHIGFSAVNETSELISGEVELLYGTPQRNEDRRMYRRNRRNRKRYRKPRFNNRRKREGWLAPSIVHKLETHERVVNQIKSILPVTEVIVGEVLNFAPRSMPIRFATRPFQALVINRAKCSDSIMSESTSFIVTVTSVGISHAKTKRNRPFSVSITST